MSSSARGPARDIDPQWTIDHGANHVSSHPSFPGERVRFCQLERDDSGSEPPRIDLRAPVYQYCSVGVQIYVQFTVLHLPICILMQREKRQQMEVREAIHGQH